MTDKIIITNHGKSQHSGEMTNEMEARIDFMLIGGPTATFTMNGVKFITDPTFSEPGEYGGLTKTVGPALQLSELPIPDVILLSHDEHADNLDDAGRRLLPEAQITLGTPESAERIPEVTGLSAWESREVIAPNGKAVIITAVPARHGPEGCESVTGTVTGFVLHGDELPTVYVSGDNAAIELVEQIAQRYPSIDIAVLFTGAARAGVLDNAALTLTAQDAVKVSQILPNTKIVPVHADGWTHFSESFEDLRKAFNDAQISDRLFIAKHGESVNLC